MLARTRALAHWRTHTHILQVCKMRDQYDQSRPLSAITITHRQFLAPLGHGAMSFGWAATAEVAAAAAHRAYAASVGRCSVGRSGDVCMT